MGPTASGKTDLAVKLVQAYPFEIISVDSALVYREMNIGTAKPDAAVLALAPHRLISFLDPAESYSVGDFLVDVRREMQSIWAANKVPLLVGGTMMYFHALLHGVADLPLADFAIREQLAKDAEEKGLAYLHQRLAQVDSVSAARIHPNDPQRIIRALEVYAISGKPLSQLHREAAAPALHFQPLQFSLQAGDRQQLHQRIARRFLQMLQEGFIEEVQRLRDRGDLDLDKASMRAVGYRQIWQYLSGLFGREELNQKAIAATSQLAKRQITWLRKFDASTWLDSSDEKVLDQMQQQLHSRQFFIG